MAKRKDEGKDGDLMPELGISRRTLLKRGAVVGGTLLWVAPVIKSLTPPAFGQTNGSPPPQNGDGCCCACNSADEQRGFCTDQFTSEQECEDACADAVGEEGNSSFSCTGQVCNDGDPYQCVSPEE